VSGHDIGSAPLRIAVVSSPWFDVPPDGYGGIERVCFHLVEGLIDRGHHVTLIANGADRTRARYLPALPDLPTGLGGIEGPAQEVRYAAAVAQVLASVDVQIVHDHSLAGPLLGRGRAVPTLVTAHGPTDGYIGDYYRRLGLPIVASSDAQRRIAPDLTWVGTVPNALDVRDYPFRADKDDYLLFLGRLSPEKGVHVAVDAARAAGSRLVIAGKCAEPHEHRYFAEFVQPRLGADTEFVGEVADTRRTDLLARAQALLVPVQWEEPFGLVSIEALASGTPVVGLRRGAIPEIVDDGRTGWVCDDAAGMTAAIRRLDEIDPRDCRAAAERRYHTTVMAAAYERIYRRLVHATAG
jgi:glycosyltransferase involved in cell wall biosynthesis